MGNPSSTAGIPEIQMSNPTLKILHVFTEHHLDQE